MTALIGIEEALRAVGGAPLLAVKTGLSIKSIYRWKKQGFVPTKESASKIRNATGVPYEALYFHRPRKRRSDYGKKPIPAE